MYQVLKKAFEQNKVVSLFINIEEPDKCNTGYIAALNEREVSRFCSVIAEMWTRYQY